MVAERGVDRSVPGCPVDVPAPLQVLMQFRVAAENLRDWNGRVDAKALEALPYVMEMAEVLGNPVRGLPVYIFSPLRLAGESLTAVMQLESRLDSVYVGNMPAVGAAVPIYPVEALALSAAETIGSAIILKECITPRLSWWFQIDPFDLRWMTMSLGSPEEILFNFAAAEASAYFHGTAPNPAVSCFHTLAKLPGPQAAAEKASAMAVGASLGARWFRNAGTLSLDEVFSPVELLIELEIKDHVERLVNGLNTEYDPKACLDDIRAAITGGFMSLDRTLNAYTDLYWHPHLFERRFLGPWQRAGSPSVEQEAARLAQDLIARHDYELAADRRRELERIYQIAERELVGCDSRAAL
jgi:trimethylamine:corrinoid methyltransferase-like protein